MYVSLGEKERYRKDSIALVRCVGIGKAALHVLDPEVFR